LLINPDGTYRFDIETVGFLQQTTVAGSDFGASSSGQPSLTAPDGLLVITGDFNGASADVKASNNGIAVGDSGLQMDQHETLVLTFTPEQSDVSFNLTQWQGNGTANVVIRVHDGATDIHDFTINIPRPSGDAHILVEQTSNLALVNTYTFNSATSTYTLYVGSEFNQIGVSYDHAVSGNATFTVNNITYSEGTTIPSTDLLFDVTAVDGDGDKSTTSLQVDVLGGTNVASGLTLSGTPANHALVGSTSSTLTDTFAATADSTAQVMMITVNGNNDGAIISPTTTRSAIEAAGALPGTPTATSTLTDTDVDSTPNTFTALNSPWPSTGGRGTFTMTAAGVLTYALNDNDSTLQALGVGDARTDAVAAATEDGTTHVVRDFASGSDRINLAASGALAFIALSPTSTSVPPHTLAWTYDSAANETIVYVNPTDQTFDIGNTALLEIHLQGVASVQESDFVYEPATATVVVAADAIDPALAAMAAGETIVLTASIAEVSLNSTVSDSEHVSHSLWSQPAADEAFHFAPGRSDLIGSARFTHVVEATANATEDSDGDAVIAVASAALVEIEHGHAAALDHLVSEGPIHASAAAAAVGDAAVLSSGGTIELGAAQAIAEMHLVAHDVTPGNDANPDHPQHAPHAPSENASAVAEVRPAEHDATPGSPAGHDHPQHAPHAPSENASPVAEVRLAEHDATPGSPASHDHPQHVPHTPSENASPVAEVRLAEHDATPGSPAGHDHPQHVPHAASANSSSNPHPESNPVAAGPGQPTPAAGHAAVAGTPGPGDSFQFSREIASAGHSGAVDVDDVGHAAASIDHGHAGGHDGPVTISETEIAGHSLAQQHAADHASVVPHHAASHMPHDLIV
jgi:VCBS repeat-containing protein